MVFRARHAVTIRVMGRRLKFAPMGVVGTALLFFADQSVGKNTTLSIRAKGFSAQRRTYHIRSQRHAHPTGLMQKRGALAFFTCEA